MGRKAFKLLEGGGESPSRIKSFFRLLMGLRKRRKETDNPNEIEAIDETIRDLNNL